MAWSPGSAGDRLPFVARARLRTRRPLAELAGIQETVLLYQADRGRPRGRRILTDMTSTKQRPYQLFDLDRYAPRR